MNVNKKKAEFHYDIIFIVNNSEITQYGRNREEEKTNLILVEIYI